MRIITASTAVVVGIVMGFRWVVRTYTVPKAEQEEGRCTARKPFVPGMWKCRNFFMALLLLLLLLLPPLLLLCTPLCPGSTLEGPCTPRCILFPPAHCFPPVFRAARVSTPESRTAVGWWWWKAVMGVCGVAQESGRAQGATVGRPAVGNDRCRCRLQGVTAPLLPVGASSSHCFLSRLLGKKRPRRRCRLPLRLPFPSGRRPLAPPPPPLR